MAYMARRSEEYCGGGSADECEIQLSYAIGVAEPTSVFVETFGTAKADEGVIAAMVQSLPTHAGLLTGLICGSRSIASALVTVILGVSL
jgi:S-adenosylmethionine synthetase